jgi:catechol 2,3-dioxygenase-like lactoylglutathione lyase family enzyme
MTIISKEPDMSNVETRRKPTSEAVRAGTINMKLEVIVIPVSDVDRAKRFYGDLGWRLDIDYTAGDDYRVIQFTPPGSGCSVIFGKNLTTAPPGSVKGLHLIVSDIQAARSELLQRGIEISEPFHDTGGIFHHASKERLAVGPNPQRKSYASYASFSDPDGNGWVFQEVTARLTGYIEAGDTSFYSRAHECDQTCGGRLASSRRQRLHEYSALLTLSADVASCSCRPTEVPLGSA